MRVVVLGRREDCPDYARYAAERGHDVRFWSPPALAGEDQAGWVRQVAQATRRAMDLAAVDDIVAFHDLYQVQLDVLRAYLGLGSRDIGSLLVLSDKRAFKAHPAVRDHVGWHLELPDGATVAEAADAIIAADPGYPLVLKPSNGFYSAGVVHVANEAGLARGLAAARRVQAVLRNNTGGGCLLVEKYLAGKEFAVDGLVTRGEVRPLLFHHKRPPLVGPYFHELAYVSESFDAGRGAVAAKMLTDVLLGVGLDDSMFHAEFRFGADGRLFLLEIAPRLSGWGETAHQMLRLSSGLDAYELLHRLPGGDLDIRPRYARAALKYDPQPSRSGVLRNSDQVVEGLVRRGAEVVLRYQHDGDFVLAPPLSFGSVVTAFFGCADVAAADRLLAELMSEYVLRTGISSTAGGS